MSGGSTKQDNTQQATTSNTINPQSMAMLQGNYQTAQGNAASLTPYTGQLTAGFTPTQTQAQGVLSGIATNPQYQAANNNAMGAVQGVLNNPAATSYNAAQLSNTDLSPYENPFTKDVINASIAQNERGRQMAQTNDSQQATAANAFGGSRSGVMAALTNGQYDQNDQANIANLNSANFSQAQAAAESDIGAKNNASQFGINAGLTGQEQQLGAAGQLAGLNQQGLNLATQQGGILSAVGDAQQAQQQSALTAAYNAYTQGQQLTVEQQNLLNSALGLIPVQQTTNSSGTGTTKTSTNPGLAGILGSLGSVAQGAAMFA